MTDTNLDHELKSQGFARIKLLEPAELGSIRTFIQKSISAAINVDVESLSSYHEFVTDAQHLTMASKKNRIFKAEDALAILDFESIKKLISSFPGYGPANVVFGQLQSEERPEVYFRLVRPHADSDVGPIHCDCWYHDLYMQDFLGSLSYKVWISIQSAESQNGLLVYPGSDQFDLNYKSLETSEGPRPVPDFDIKDAGAGYLVPTTPGDAIIFSDKMLHQGAINAAETTRISVEITLRRMTNT
jgi:hypothetical protein